ncbi:MAG TPA: G5 domain-containing protein [Candidatus Dormibacteraeota bacterium]|nr:G5 domain-containing protein [Candidatus Dormibacteraeota bacterium]
MIAGLAMLAAAALGLIVFWLVSTQARADSSRIVSIFYDGSKKVITVESEATVGEALRLAEVPFASEDLVEPNPGTKIPQGFFNVNVYRARPALVVDGVNHYQVRTAFQSPKLVAEAAGLTVYAEDTYSVETIQDFTAAGVIGHKVVINRATPIIFASDGRQIPVRTHQKTVGDLLTERDVAFGPKDTVEPGRETAITTGMTIRIYRVKTVNTTVEESIPRTVKTVRDPQLESGITQVQTEGADGLRKVTYRVHYEDGAEKSREKIAEVTASQPVTRVVLVGTKPRSDAWLLLRLCEAGGSYTRNSGNGYYGAYQFNLSTWWSNGGTGYPHQASPAEQDRIAARLQAARGWSPWPACAKRLGLL